MKNIILGVTGGIASYKACDVISGLTAKGFDVRVIMTKHAMEFITPLTLATLSKHPVMHDMWVERNGSVEHIEVAKWADAFVVYPATVNIMAKFANGIADDLLSTVYLALPKKVTKIVFPAANTNMVQHNASLRNMEILKGDGVVVTDTLESKLACGDIGKGAVLKPREAIEIIVNCLEPKKSPQFQEDKPKQELCPDCSFPMTFLTQREFNYSKHRSWYECNKCGFKSQQIVGDKP